MFLPKHFNLTRLGDCKLKDFFLSHILKNLACWFAFLIPQFQKLKQENCHELEDSLGYIMRPCLQRKEKKEHGFCYFSFGPRFWLNKLIQLVILKLVRKASSIYIINKNMDKCHQPNNPISDMSSVFPSYHMLIQERDYCNFRSRWESALSFSKIAWYVEESRVNELVDYQKLFFSTRHDSTRLLIASYLSPFTYLPNMRYINDKMSLNKTISHLKLL